MADLNKIELTTRWWWVRHAPVVGVNGAIYGDNDVECDITDTISFENLARRLPSATVCLTSNLSRTKETFQEICNKGLNAAQAITEADLKEQSFGDWQGATWDEMHSKSPKAYNKFWEDPTRNNPPGGESFADQIKRVGKIIDKYTNKFGGHDILAVCHGGTIRAAITYTLGLSPETGMAFSINTLSTTQIEHVEGGLLKGKGGAWRIVSINTPAKDVVI